MEALDKNSEEYKTLFQYATKSKNNGVTIGTIFRVQRKGEAERIAKWKSLDNHYLLWHGSDVSNYMGILSTGQSLFQQEKPRNIIILYILFSFQ
jgi:poly [ADP-ribose] polymerase